MRATRDELVRRWGRGGDALYTAVASGVALAALGTLAATTGRPLLFASLGPTAFLIFETPTAPNASPRSCVGGHLVAVVAGWLSLVAFGLLGSPDALAAGVDAPRIGAAALSMVATGGGVVLLRVRHPPAGATALLVSLGFLTTAAELAAIMVGVLLLTVLGWVVNRAFGLDVPIWSAAED